MEEAKVKKKRRKNSNDGLITAYNVHEMARIRRRHGLIVNEERMRHCLRCDLPFMSEGYTNRMCVGCSKYMSGQ